MRLKRKECDRKNRKIKVTFTSEIDENFVLRIGVVSPRVWDERIFYHMNEYDHVSGYIRDDFDDIKEVNKVKTTLYVEDNLFMIVNKNEHIRELTFKNNRQAIFRTFYRACSVLEEKVFCLRLRDPVTIEVETGKVVFVNFFDIDFKSNDFSSSNFMFY